MLISKFGFMEVSGSRHEAVAFYYAGRKIATTRFSRGSRTEISDALLSVMAKEIRVQTLAFIKKMLDCTKSKQEFIDRLRELGFIS